MIITFFGHRSLIVDSELQAKIEKIIDENTDIRELTSFYCGGYGDFDVACAHACQAIKKRGVNCEIALITPYITPAHQRKVSQMPGAMLYDLTVYPPLEGVPPKFAISARNKWMVDSADLIIAYVSRPYGGAYKALKYARRKNKHIINLADLHPTPPQRDSL